MKTNTKIVLTVCLIGSWWFLATMLNTGAESAKAGAATLQLSNNDGEALAGLAAAQSSLPSWLGLFVNVWGVAMLGILWVVPMFKSKKAPIAAVALLGMSALMTACGPPKIEQFEEVEPDETAFMFKLEGDSLSGQQKFESVEFLEERKVAGRRISLPLREHKTGRMSWQYRWIPTARVVTVRRTPVTREWTPDETTGTNSGDEGIRVESLDSVGFTVGANVTAKITEANAATFLYNFNGMSLADVIDKTVRGVATEYLSGEFGALPLDSGDVVPGQEPRPSCKTEKKRISQGCLAYLREHFGPMGVTIDSFGLVGGLEYDDPKIQESITRQIEAQQDLIIARAERAAQTERNARDVEKAEAAKAQAILEAEAMAEAEMARASGEATAAKTIAEAAEAVLMKLEVYERTKNADAKVEAAKALTNVRIIPSGSPLLMGLDTKD